jgi:hypothetical protein
MMSAAVIQMFIFLMMVGLPGKLDDSTCQTPGSQGQLECRFELIGSDFRNRLMESCDGRLFSFSQDRDDSFNIGTSRLTTGQFRHRDRHIIRQAKQLPRLQLEVLNRLRITGSLDPLTHGKRSLWHHRLSELELRILSVSSAWQAATSRVMRHLRSRHLDIASVT